MLLTWLPTAAFSLQRWQRASWGEESYWSAASSTADAYDDNAGTTLELFKNYEDVPRELGNVMELGCGPFTQVRV